MKTKNVAVTLHLTIPSRMSSQRCQELIEQLLSAGWDDAAAVQDGPVRHGNAFSAASECKEALSIELREFSGMRKDELENTPLP